MLSRLDGRSSLPMRTMAMGVARSLIGGLPVCVRVTSAGWSGRAAARAGSRAGCLASAVGTRGAPSVSSPPRRGIVGWGVARIVRLKVSSVLGHGDERRAAPPALPGGRAARSMQLVPGWRQAPWWMPRCRCAHPVKNAAGTACGEPVARRLPVSPATHRRPPRFRRAQDDRASRRSDVTPHIRPAPGVSATVVSPRDASGGRSPKMAKRLRRGNRSGFLIAAPRVDLARPSMERPAPGWRASTRG